MGNWTPKGPINDNVYAGLPMLFRENQCLLAISNMDSQESFSFQIQRNECSGLLIILSNEDEILQNGIWKLASLHTVEHLRLSY